MGECASVLLPVDAIKVIDRDIERVPVVQASPGHGEAIWIRSWNIKAFDPANAAEFVLRLFSVECIGDKRIRSPDEPEAARWDDDVNISAHPADGAVAILHFNGVRQVDFEPDSPAMTTSGARLQWRGHYMSPTQTGGLRCAHGAAASS